MGILVASCQPKGSAMEGCVWALVQHGVHGGRLGDNFLAAIVSSAKTLFRGRPKNVSVKSQGRGKLASMPFSTLFCPCVEFTDWHSSEPVLTLRGRSPPPHGFIIQFERV